MSEPLEEAYFNWLCAKVLSPTSFDTYYGLLLVLHRTEFDWSIRGDENRAKDGMELRLHFLREREVPSESGWFECPCSVLELLVAFAGVAEFETGISFNDWFWLMIRNLGLEDYRRISDQDIPAIKQILDRFIFRRYGESGDGGLFPMYKPEHDQSVREIWYQFCDYVAYNQLV